MPSPLLHASVLLLWQLILDCEGVPWDTQNDPRWWWSPSPILLFSSLPLSGNSSTHKGWSGSYWPNKNGGIAHRWQQGWNTPTFNYTLHTLQELKNMSLDELKGLSPAEKYDIFNNRLDYPTVLSEWKRTSPKDPDWFGLCHGWAPASTLYDEPDPVTLKADNGIEIPFGASDIEGLLTYFLAMYRTLTLKFLGRRCEQEKPDTDLCLQDLNAGTLMVLLGNDIGLQGRMLIFDVEPGKEIWNQPISGYNCVKQDVGNPDRIQVTCEVRYITETGQTWYRQVPNIGVERYKFALDLRAGYITGGTYIHDDGYRNPDFAWSARSPPPFSGYMTKLGIIYNASTVNSTDLPTPPPPSPSPVSPTWSPQPEATISTSVGVSPTTSPSPVPETTSPLTVPWATTNSPSPASTTTTTTVVPRYVYNTATGAWEVRYYRVTVSPSPTGSSSTDSGYNEWRPSPTDPTMATYRGNIYVYDTALGRWILRTPATTVASSTGSTDYSGSTGSTSYTASTATGSTSDSGGTATGSTSYTGSTTTGGISYSGGTATGSTGYSGSTTTGSTSYNSGTGTGTTGYSGGTGYTSGRTGSTSYTSTTTGYTGRTGGTVYTGSGTTTTRGSNTGPGGEPRRPFHVTAVVSEDIDELDDIMSDMDFDIEPLYTTDEEALCQPSESITLNCTKLKTKNKKGSAGQCRTAISFERLVKQTSPLCAMWKVFCPSNSSRMEVSVKEFQNIHARTELKFYEAIDGPLSASFSGRTHSPVDTHTPVQVPATSVRIVFESLSKPSSSERISLTVLCLP